eukprot:g6680.t1
MSTPGGGRGGDGALNAVACGLAAALALRRRAHKCVRAAPPPAQPPSPNRHLLRHDSLRVHFQASPLNTLGVPFRPSGTDTRLMPAEEKRLPGGGEIWARSELDYGPKADVLHTGRSKLVVVFMGKPGSGKTYYARKLGRYLCWMKYAARVFTYAQIREQMYGKYQAPGFFSMSNEAGVEKREAVCQSALESATAYLASGGEIAVLDGTNSTRARRGRILDHVRANAGATQGARVIWVECVCDDDSIREALMRERWRGPEYRERFSSEHEMRADFERRCQQYQQTYEPVGGEEGQSMQIFDAASQSARKVVLRGLAGHVPTQIASFLLNVHTVPKRVFLTRHGESMYNVQGLIGGDPPLSPEGQKYASALAHFMRAQQAAGGDAEGMSRMQIWSSTMRRTQQTAHRLAAELVPARQVVSWRCLQEIDVGVCDSLTYDQVKAKWPEEFEARAKDKLRYRYPRGESYLDIIERIQPVILGLEQQVGPVMVVAHQAVLRCLYAYFHAIPPHKVPHLSIPLHEVIEIVPQTYGCTERRHKLMGVDPHSEVSQKDCLAPART